MTQSWQTERLGKLTTRISSGSTPKGGRAVYLDAGPVMLIRSQNVRMTQLDLSDVAYITDEIDREMQRSVVQEGDVLLNITGASIGRVTEFDLQDVRANVNQHVCIVRPKSTDLDSRFLMHFLSSPSAQRDIHNKHQHGGTRQALTFSQIGDFTIPLPPLSEQKRIAGILDQADGLRRKRQQALSLTDQFLRSTFLDLFGDPVTNPKQWPVSDVGTIADQVTDGEHNTPKRSSSGIKLISARNIRNGYLDFDVGVDFVDQAEFDRIRKRCEPRIGDILISCSGSIGRVTCVRSPEPLAMVRSVALVRPKQETVNATYFEHYLRTDRMKSVMESRAKSSSQANLFQGPIRELPVLIPPMKIQRRFAAMADGVLKFSGGHARSVDAFDDLFHSLVQRAFRGEL